VTSYRRLWVGIGTGVLAAVLVVGGLALRQSDSAPESSVSTGGDGPAGGTIADETTTSTELAPIDVTSVPESTTSTLSTVVATTTTRATTTTTIKPGPRVLLAESSASDQGQKPWKLWVGGTGAKRCLTLDVSGTSNPGLLCDAPAADRPFGASHAVAAGDNVLAMVSVVEPRVTAIAQWNEMIASSSRVVADPARAGISYAVSLQPTGGMNPIQMFAAVGTNHIAVMDVPKAPGPLSGAALNQRTDKPYGIWPGYRKVGISGFYWGGMQDYGFYDGPNGIACVLYRRLGASEEKMFADACPAKDAARPVPFATLSADRRDGSGGWRFLAVSDVLIDAYSCARPDGSSCTPGEPHIYPDPGGSGRYVACEFLSIIDDQGADHLTFTFTNAGATITTVNVPVPR
jgi:hypothetical protein